MQVGVTFTFTFTTFSLWRSYEKISLTVLQYQQQTVVSVHPPPTPGVPLQVTGISVQSFEQR